MPADGDPFAVLGVKPTASDAEIHAAYRAGVRRTHPDAGGSAAAFEAIQLAYETLRDPAARARLRDASAGTQARRPTEAPRARDPSAAAPDPGAARRRMDDLLAESRRLEDEARRLAGLPPRYEPPEPGEQGEDTIGAVMRDAGTQLADVADDAARGLRRLLRRIT
jgi:curved DNA-binding protein CbpA